MEMNDNSKKENLFEVDITGEPYKKIAEDRVKEICDKYIAKSINDKKPITEEDVAELSCTELVGLYYNTEWYIENFKSDNENNTGLENQLMLMELIKKRIEENKLYVIHTSAANLPFFPENEAILVYTEKKFANKVADEFSIKYVKQDVEFKSVEIFEDKEAYWHKMLASGIETISVDGTKYTIKISELVKEVSDYKNAVLGRVLIRYAEAMRIGKNKDKIPIFQNAILKKLKENPKVISGPIKINGVYSFYSVYLDSHKSDEEKQITVKFDKICSEILKNEKINGLVLNPDNEHIVIPREKILEVHKEITAGADDSSDKKNKCAMCGKAIESSTIIKNGLCVECAGKSLRKVTTGTSSQSKPAPNKPKLVYNSMYSDSESQEKYANLCLICGIISIFFFLISFFTFDNASKAIRIAKTNGKAVSSRVWLGMVISGLTTLFYIFFFFLPIIF